MEILVIIVAFWLTLVGVYGGLSLLAESRRTRSEDSAQDSASASSTSHGRPSLRRGLSRSTVPSGTRTGASALPPVFSEVDLLRAQVEHLRTEVVVLSGAAASAQKPRLRRHRTGVYTELPGTLRRQVREARHVRQVRHPLSV